MRNYLPGPVERLTSNERSVALTLFKSLALSPRRHVSASSAAVIAAECTVAIGTQVPSASSPVSCYRAAGQKNCENTTAPEELIVGSCADAIDFSIYWR